MPARHAHSSFAGFTLVEVIVTMAIMAFILSISLASFNSRNSNSGPQRTAETISSDLRLAVQKALLNEDLQQRSPTGWGIYFDVPDNSYTIFADFDGDRLYDPVEKFRSVKLSSDTKLVKAEFTSSTFTDPFSVFFKNGLAYPYFQNGKVNTASGPVTIELTNEAGTRQAIVHINAAGVIEIQ